MKRKTIFVTLLLGLVLLFADTQAQVITADRAKAIANSFFSAGKQKSAAARGFSSESLTESYDSNTLLGEDSGEAPTFHVVANPGGGFVVVSGEETGNPIIGYSFDSEFTTESELPAGLADYLKDVDAQVRALREYNAAQPQKSAASRSAMQRAAYNATSMGNIVKELNTAPWDQDAPFNNYCFVYTYNETSKTFTKGSNALTGCVPTAYAILCHYYNWPVAATGTGYHSSGAETITFGHEYDYANMRNDNYSGTYTEAEANAVATLMRDLGYAYQVTYGTGDTPSEMKGEGAAVLIEKFGFTSLSTTHESETYATSRGDEATWKTLIKNSLDQDHPIPYSAYNPNSGGRHIFMLDGYTDNGYYHFNFGWGGDGNGWFTLDNVAPTDYNQYTQSHKAYFELVPNKTQYTVTATAEPSTAGTVTVNGVAGSAQCFENSQATLVATAMNGYRFTKWTKNGVDVSTSKTCKVAVGASDNDYVAHFEEYDGPAYTVTTYSVDNSKVTEGDFQPSSTAFCSSWTYNDPAFTLKATANGGEDAYALHATENCLYASTGTESNVSSPFSTDIKYTLTAPEGCLIKGYSFDCECLGDYEINVTYGKSRATATVTKNPTVTIAEDELYVESVEFTLNTTCTNSRARLKYSNFTVAIATENEGGGEPVTPPAAQKYNVTVTMTPSWSPTGNMSDATVSGGNSCEVDANSTVTLRAVCSTGYSFVGWYIGEELISDALVYDYVVTGDADFIAKFEKAESAELATDLGGKMFRLKEIYQNKYLNIDNYDTHETDPEGGVNVTAKDESSDDQIFLFVESGDGYKLKSESGYYIVGHEWNVDANTQAEGAASVLLFEEAGDNYMIKWHNTKYNAEKYFKVGETESTAIDGIYVYCDVDKNTDAGKIAVWALEEVVYCTVGTSATAGGSAAPATQTVERGKQVTVNATVTDDAYEFVSWTDGMSVVSNDASYTFTVSDNVALVANFQKKRYTITAAANPANGGVTSISVGGGTGGTGTGGTGTGGTGATSASEIVEHGTDVALSANEKTGYRFVRWTKNGSPASDVAYYTFTVTENAGYVAEFEKIPYTIEYIVDGEAYNVVTAYYQDVITALEAPVKEGHTFSGWTGLPVDMKMPAGNVTVSGTFAVNSYTVTYIVDGETYATETVEYGAVLPAVTAPEKEGYTFTGWGEIPDTMPAEDITLVANFEVTAPAVNNYEITVTVSAGTNNVVNGTDVRAYIARNDGDTNHTQMTFAEGASVELIAVNDYAGKAYILSGWYKNDVLVSEDNTITVNVTEAASYEARFEKGLTVSVRGNNCNADVYDENKLDAIGTGRGVVKSGTVVTLSASYYPQSNISPENGYVFAGWMDAEGNVINENMEFKHTVTADVRFYAVVEMAYYSLTVSTPDNAMGSVSAESGTEQGQSVEVGYNMSATITATPAAGYEFVNWTKGAEVVSTEPIYNIAAIDNVEDMADVEYVANFERTEVEGAGYYRIAYDFQVPVGNAVATVAAEGDTYVVSKSTGNEAESSYPLSSWTYKKNGNLQADLTLSAKNSSGNVNNIIKTSSTNANAEFSLQASKNRVSTTVFTISVPEGGDYVITGYNINFRVYKGVVVNDGSDEYTYSGGNNGKIGVTGLNTRSVEFTVTTTGDQNACLDVDLFEVYIKNTAAEPQYETQRLYMQSEAVGGTNNALKMTADTGAASIFYYDGANLLSYTKGTCLREEGTYNGLQAVGETAGAVTITDSNNGTAVITAPNYLHAMENNGVYYVGSDNVGTHGAEHNFIVEKVTSLPVTISAAGYSTFYAPVPVTVPAGVEAYYIAEGDLRETTAHLTGITTGVIPANTAVILKGNAGTYDFEITESDALLDGTNLLKGKVMAEYVYENAYVLSMQTGEIGLYKAKLNQDGNTAFLCNGHKAYLPFAASSGANLSAGFRFVFPGTTGIEGVGCGDADGTIYDLSGRRLEGVTAPGVYIVNGRKVLVK